MNTENIDKTEKSIPNINELDITNADDRNTFEQECLYPALKLIYSGIMGSANKPIIVGSTALYLQGIYYDKFPNDIDVRILNKSDILKYKIAFGRMCKKYGFNVDFVTYDIQNTDETSYVEINIDDKNISVDVPERCIDFLQTFRDFYKEKNNSERVQKYTEKLTYLQEHYPELFSVDKE